MIHLLDGVAPGTMAKIVGDSMRGWPRVWRRGIDAIRRAGLRPTHCMEQPPPLNRQCEGRSRQHKRRCLRWAVHGRRFCYVHGGRAINGAALSLAERAERRKRKQARNRMRLQRWYERLERKRLGLLPASVGFVDNPTPSATSLEAEFTSGRGAPPRSKLYDPTK
jgi:hypothetical protein